MLSGLKRMFGFGSGVPSSAPEVSRAPVPEVSRVMEEVDKGWEGETEILRERPVNEGEPPTTSLKVEKDEKGRKFLVKENGIEVRGRVSEDAKINDSENGLMLVADGVSGESIENPDGSKEKPYTGVLASTIMAETAQAYLGKRLTETIEKLKQEKLPNISENIDAVVIREMARTIFRANKQVMDPKALLEKAKQIFKDDPDFLKKIQKRDLSGSLTTASLSRRVTMPDGKERLYYTNVGDSRIYIFRINKQTGAREAIQLSNDDSAASFLLARDMGLHDPNNTPDRKNQLEEQYKETLNKIEQAQGAQALPDELQKYFHVRNQITRAVGALNKGRVPVSDKEFLTDLEGRVRYTDLEDEDEIVKVSDGVSDNLTLDQIKEVVFDDSDEAKKKPLEQRLQEKSEAIIRDVKNPRSKADDVAAVRQKVGAKNTVRRVSNDDGEMIDPSEIEEIPDDVSETMPSVEEVAQWEKMNNAFISEIASLDKKLSDQRKLISRIETRQRTDLLNQLPVDSSLNEHYRALKDEEQELLDQRLDVQSKQAPYKRWFAIKRYNEILPTLPKPLESKTQVILPESFRSEDLDEKIGSDGGSVNVVAGWRNGGYDAKTNSYLVSRGKAIIWVPRLELDLAQEYAKNPLLALKPGDSVRSGKNEGWNVQEVEETSILLTNPKGVNEYRMVSVDRSAVKELEEAVYLQQQIKEADDAEKAFKQMEEQRRAEEEAEAILGARTKAQNSAR